MVRRRKSAAPQRRPPHRSCLAHTFPLALSSHAKPVDSFSDASALADALTRVVRGEVRFDRGSRALYATDGSNYRQVLIGVVVPRDLDDVEAIVEVCRTHGAPILSRGGDSEIEEGLCRARGSREPAS